MPQPRPTAKSLENLKKGKPFKKGQTGNPKGRPKVIPEINILLAKVLGDERDGITAAEAILKSLLHKAVKGDVRAAEVLLDRGYGKAIQHVKSDGVTTINFNREK